MAKVFMEDEELNDVMDTEEVIDCGDDSDVDETIPAEEETTSSIEEPEQKDASEEKNSGDPTENEEEVTTEPEEDVDSEFSVEENNTDSDTDSTGGEDDSSNTDDEVEDDSDIDNDIMTLPLDSEEGLVTEQADDIPPGKRWDTYDENEDDIEDTDEIMALDTSSGSNKRLPFSKIGDWLVNKLTNAVIKNLQTQNQTVIGAINELNSKAKNYTFDPNKNVEIFLEDGKAVLVFFSRISLSNIADNGFGIAVTRTGSKYSGKYTEIAPLNGVTIFLDGNNLKIDSKSWLRIIVVTL